MSKGSFASGALVLVLTGGYFGYEEYQKRSQPKTNRPPAAGSATSATSATVPAKPGADGAAKPAPAQTEPATPAVRELEVPNLVGLTPEEARAKLTEVGFAPNVLEMPKDMACKYADEKDMVKQGTICNQGRSPGIRQMSNAKVRVTIEYDTYESGGIESGSVWRRMPNVEGLTLDAARSLLRDQGFSDDEFEIEERSSCGKNTVCEQTPRAGNRKYVTSPGRLNLGT